MSEVNAVSVTRRLLQISLAEFGIRLRDGRRGERRAACPRCAGTKHRPRDDALAIKLEPDGGAAWCCHRCGWKGSLRSPAEPQKLRHRAAFPAPRKVTQPDKAEHNRELARQTWRETETIPEGGEAWRYLRDVRRLWRWDADRVRWHGTCPWGAGNAGCIVVPVNDHATGSVTAIWRIRPALEGTVERRGLGPMRGCASRLFPAGGPQLVVAEGVEDALAARELTGLAAWAALSATNMGALILPAWFREVLVLADRDANGVGQNAAHELAARLRAEGRHAEVRRPTTGKDANDVLSLGREAR